MAEDTTSLAPRSVIMSLALASAADAYEKPVPHGCSTYSIVVALVHACSLTSRFGLGLRQQKPAGFRGWVTGECSIITPQLNEEQPGPREDAQGAGRGKGGRRKRT